MSRIYKIQKAWYPGIYLTHAYGYLNIVLFFCAPSQTLQSDLLMTSIDKKFPCFLFLCKHCKQPVYQSDHCTKDQILTPNKYKETAYWLFIVHRTKFCRYCFCKSLPYSLHKTTIWPLIFAISHTSFIFPRGYVKPV